MKNVLIYLKQLGLSETEAKLYIVLLKSGSLTVAELAESAKINRTAAYSHINSLLEKGIIAKVKGSTNKIAANPPDDLRYLVEQKLYMSVCYRKSFPRLFLFSIPLSPIQTKLHHLKLNTIKEKPE